MTLRDLFRWGERYARAQVAQPNFHDWNQYIADQGGNEKTLCSNHCLYSIQDSNVKIKISKINFLGYLLLGGRCRRADDEQVVRSIIEKQFGRGIDADNLFSLTSPYLPAVDSLNKLKIEGEHPKENLELNAYYNYIRFIGLFVFTFG